MMATIFKCLPIVFYTVTVIFTFVPESFFSHQEWISTKLLEKCNFFSWLNFQDINITISRLILFLLVWFVTLIPYVIYIRVKGITIKGKDYLICIKYGNIFSEKNCKRVISFDECFTIRVGNQPSDINDVSICGQYLKNHPNLDIQQLIQNANVSPARSRSKYRGQIRYDSGTIVPHGDDLLLAFAKLDERGKGRFFTRDEYLECLHLLWREIEIHYSEKNVCVPILGAGTTAFEGGSGASISKQDLLDMMIWSYRLSAHKIKLPHKLYIICKKSDDFSLNNIKSN